MGLGKTIMIASLMHTNRASEDDEPSSSDEAEPAKQKAEVQAKPAKPKDSAAGKGSVSKARQQRLSFKPVAPAGGGPGKLSTTSPPKWAKKVKATLVVCPVTLLEQWKHEMCVSKVLPLLPL